jgi:uncharacterized protein
MAEPLPCPICRKPVAIPAQVGVPAAGAFPFCSERCKLVDLGRWLSGAYQIPVVDTDPDDPATEPDRP